MKKMDRSDVTFYQDMLIFVFLFVVLCAIGGFINYAAGNKSQPNQQAQAAIENQGYTNVTPLGVDYLTCPTTNDGANIGYSFKATNPIGAEVMLTACKTHGILHPLGGWQIITQ